MRYLDVMQDSLDYIEEILKDEVAVGKSGKVGMGLTFEIHRAILSDN